MLNHRLNSTVTYWAKGTPDGYGGFTYASPVALNGRWEERIQLFVNQAGNQQQSKAMVFLEDDVEIGGFLYLGTSTDSAPSAVGNLAYEILGFSKIPSIDGSDYERRAYL